MNYQLRRLAETTEEVALQIAWDQWAILGAEVPWASSRSRESLVDPDALILLTLSLLPCDDRLQSVSAWWARSCSPMASVKRLRRLLSDFPVAVHGRMGFFAAIAAEVDDLRWSRLATPAEISINGDHRPADVLNPSSLILRMRLIFGVNPTADVITYLLSRGNQPATARQIGVATGYGRSSIHRVLERLIAAKIAGRNKTRPATFMLCAEAWQEMLGRSVIRTDVRSRVGFRRGYFKNTAAPMWLCWTQVFAFLAMLQDACRLALTSHQPHREVLQPVRDQFHKSRKVFIEHNLMLPSLNPYGDQYILSLQENISILSAWYDSNA